jgi:hypothetical protein
MNTLHLIQAPMLIKSLDLNIHKALRDVVSTCCKLGISPDELMEVTTA